MSDRYETIDATITPVAVRPAGYDFGYDDLPTTPSLVIGDVESSALVVIGTPEDLTDVAHRIRTAVAGLGSSPATEVRIDHDPEGGTRVRVWVNGQDVTDDPGTVVTIDNSNGLAGS